MSDLDRLSPFKTSGSCCKLINEAILDVQLRTKIQLIAKITQCPAHLKLVIDAVLLCRDLRLIGAENVDRILNILRQSNLVKQGSVPKRIATNYPVFYGLKKIHASPKIEGGLKTILGRLYVDIFFLDRIRSEHLDPDIYYQDAYSARDVLIEFFGEFNLERNGGKDRETLKNIFISHFEEILEKNRDNQNKRGKLNRFFDILSGERLPGARQKEKARQKKKGRLEKETALYADPSGNYSMFAYPSEESFEPKTVSRSTPKKGSQLSRVDDRRALRGRINSQAARNVIAITDMHRLPLPMIVKFLSSLNESPIGICICWLLLTTGISPNRLLKLTLDEKEHNNICLQLSSGILGYTVNNRLDSKSKNLMQLQLNPLVARFIRLLYAKSEISDIDGTLKCLISKFSSHHSGVSPTLERIAASSVLHFSAGVLNEFEVAHLSGDIPARLRAQVHYYSVDLSKLNRKWQVAHKNLVQKILSMDTCTGRFRLFLDSFETFPSTLPREVLINPRFYRNTTEFHFFRAAFPFLST